MNEWRVDDSFRPKSINLFNCLINPVKKKTEPLSFVENLWYGINSKNNWLFIIYNIVSYLNLSRGISDSTCVFMQIYHIWIIPTPGLDYTPYTHPGPWEWLTQHNNNQTSINNSFCLQTISVFMLCMIYYKGPTQLTLLLPVSSQEFFTL